MTNASWWRDPSELDTEQKRVIALPKDQSHLVLGPPGSGKTNLLLLRAQYLAKLGSANIAVLMFTRTLREFVVNGGTSYGLPADRVQTFVAWEQSLLREHGVPLPSQTLSFQERRLQLTQRLAELFNKKRTLEHQIECVLVDEVQDALPEELALFRRAGKQVFFVGDNRQQIYQSPTEGLGGGDIQTHHLTFHYRNGRKICALADAIGAQMGEGAMLDACNYVEKNNASSAKFEQCSDDIHQLDRLSAQLQTQLLAYPDELLGVALAKAEDAKMVRAKLAASSLAQYICEEDRLSDGARPDARIFVSTIHDAKGLEFRTMHLPFAERVQSFQERQKRVSYTAITRAKTAFTAYFIQPLPKHLEQARQKLIGPRPEPSVDDLFPRRDK